MFNGASSFDQNLGNWYVTLDPDTIASTGIPGVVGTISAQNQPLKNHSPTYVIVDGLNKNHFEIVPGNQLNMTSGVSGKAEYSVNVTASGGRVFESGNNWRLLEIKVTGQTTDTTLPADAFATTWRTTTADESITLPISGSGMTVDWGDGNTTTGVSAPVDHTYNTAGNYTVSISGGLERFHLDSQQPNAGRLASIEQWGDTRWTTMHEAFYGARNMAYNAADSPDLSTVTDMSGMFGDASSFNGNISGWDVSKVTNMDGMFDEATSFNQPLNSWNVSSVKNMGWMFDEATSFNQTLNSWDVSSVTTMYRMFNNATSFNQTLNSWDVSSVTDMARMFNNATSFNQTLNSWDVSSVTDMFRMFNDADSFNQPLNSWNVSRVTSMFRMFNDADSFNQPLNSWNVSRVTNMDDMFNFATAFSQNLGNWYVTLDPDTIAGTGIPGVVGTLSAQNQPLKDHTPTYGIVDGLDKNHFEIISGNRLNMTSGVPGEYSINVTASGGSVFESGNNWRVLAVSVSGDNNADLYSLTISPGTLSPEFSSSVTAYTASVDNSVTHVTVTPTASDSLAAIVVDGDDVASGTGYIVTGLTVGEPTTVTVVVVVAQDFTIIKIYTITLTRAAAALSDNADLGGLTISSGTLSPQFSSSDIAYTASVDNSVTHVTVTPTASDSLAAITVNGDDVASGTGYIVTGLTVGEPTTVTVIVAAQDSTTKTYTVTLTRAAALSDTPPTFVSSKLDSETGVLTIIFSKDIDATPNTRIVPDKIHIRESGSYTGGVTLTAGELGTTADGTTISFTLNVAHLKTVAELSDPKLTIDPGAVQDTSDNLIEGTFDVSTATYVRKYSVESGNSTLTDVEFSNNGTKMFIVGGNGDDVTPYALIRAFDLTSVSPSGAAFSLSSYNPDPQSLEFSNDGTKMFVVGIARDNVTGYALSTAFDVSTATYVNAFNVRSEDHNPQGLAFSNDGTKMFVVGKTNKHVYEYTLPTAFDVSTAVHVYSFPVGLDARDPFDVEFSNDGTKMFVVDKNLNDVHEYTLSIAFDVSTATFANVVFSVSEQDPSPRGMAFSNDGAKMFVIGSSSSSVNEYALSSVYPLNVVSNMVPAEDRFVTTWRTGDDNETVTIPVYSGPTYYYTVIWGDGTNSTGVTEDASHTYAAAGDHQVRIYGIFLGIHLDGHGDASKLASIDQWGSNRWVSMASAFKGASSMEYEATDAPDLSGVTNMTRMFSGAESFDGDLSNWNVSQVTDMSSMFSSADAFDGDLSNWNVSQVTDMSYMFSSAGAFDGDLSNWNVSQVTDMSSMFAGAGTFDGDISSWSVSQVTDMSYMFSSANNFNQPLNGWDVSAVNTMSNMFFSTPFNRPLNDWDVSSVTDMSGMFTFATSFDSPLNGWDVSAVNTMSNMFFSTPFNRPLNDWDVSSVTDMSGMFHFAFDFDQNLGEWYVTLDPDTIAGTGIPGVVGTISAQNQHLNDHSPTYVIVDDLDVDHFEIVSNRLNMTSGVPGEYSINVTASGTRVFEDGGNWRLLEIKVTGQTSDNTPPTLSLTGDTSVTISVGTTYNDEGATCEDTVDGTIIPTVVSNTVDTTQVGNYAVTYSCTDAANNSATQVSRTVIVEDTTPPTLSLTGDTSVTISVGTTYNDEGATCEDTVDGTIIPTVVSNTVDTTQVGNYAVTYSCTDAANNSATQVSRTVIVEDTTPPTLSLTGDTSVTISVGTTYNDEGATCEDTVDGTIIPTVVSNTVDTTQVGNYAVTYSCTDAANNSATQVSRTVIVEDTTPPTLSLTGDTSVTISVGTTYNDEGATCEDTVDGTIIPTVVSNTVDTTQVGNYAVTYSCTDAANNSATQVSRTVIVEDTTPPELTLTGSSSVTIEAGDSYSDDGAECTDTVDGTITPTKTFDDVDTSQVGSYTVTYSCADAATNTVTVSRTVIVEDTTPPELTLTGSSSVTIEVDDPYSDDGATCRDTVDGTITPTKTFDDVDTSQVGSYTVTYSCADAATNTVTVSRTVNVETSVAPDNTPPELTLTGSSSVTIEANVTYTDAGADCLDGVDGTITPTKTFDNVDTSQVGSYTVTYSCVDVATNTVTVSRTVIVEDTTPPELTLTGSSSVTIEVDDPYSDDGATCRDTVDGTITPTKTFDDVDTSQVGSYTVTYSCADAATNTVTVSRTVIVEDTTPPELTLTGSSSVTIEAGDSYSDDGAECTDTVDGIITPTKTFDNVDTSQVGSYTVTYSCADAATNTVTVSRTVIVEDTTPPELTLTGSSSVTIEANVIYTDAGADCLDGVDGTITPTKTFDNVDTSQVGSYTVTYSCVDVATNTVTVSRTVIVEDTTPPELTLTGSSSVTIEVDDPYSDDGATCRDTVDGTITPTKTFDDVDTSQVGSYTVTYSCADAATNTVTVSRTVNVETSVAPDNTPPELTLTGSSSVTIEANVTYTDAGADCLDGVDGTITPTKTFDNVDTSQVGSYTVTYSCVDVATNTVTVSRTVIVEDTTPPELTLTGSSSVTIEVDDPYSDDGATCRDTVDGTITPTKTFDNVDTSQVGSYTVTYSCADAATNTVTVSRTVNVETSVAPDNTPPELTLTGSSSVTIEANVTYTDAGADCLDGVDGTITPTKTFDNVDTSQVGSYTVTYSCVDAATNTVTVSRTVIVEDTTPPELTLTGSSSVTIEAGDSYSDDGAECTDTVDGTITPTKTFDNVDTSQVGSYTVTYSCVDAATNTVTVSRTVIVEDTTPPELTLTGSSSVTIEAGDSYSDDGAECTDTVDASPTLTSTSTVDTSQTGSYTVTYSCTDAAGNVATQVSRTVIVQQGPDITPPVIIIHGSNPARVLVGTVYSDAGAMCRDNFDGDFAPTSTISTVNASKAGSYTVTYTCIDVENNESEKTRTVRVLEEGDFTRSKSSKSTPLTVDNDVIIDGKSHDIGGSGTVTIKQNEVMTGEPVDITFTAHSADDIIHLTVYLNLHGDDTGYAYSDTYIRYDHGTVQIHDPHNFISDASITITDDTEQPDKKIIDIIIEFDGDMGLTNMVLYMWNEDRRSQLIRILDAFEVVAALLEPVVQAADPEPLEPDSVLPADPEPVALDFADDAADPEPVPADALWPADDYDEAQVLTLIRMWSGFESEMITDTQLLELLGLEGYQDVDLPDWMMTQLGVLVARGDVTVDEFMLALQYVLTHT